MKKLFALLLAAAMVLSMAACGGKTEAPATTAAPETTAAPAATELPSPDFPQPAVPSITNDAKPSDNNFNALFFILISFSPNRFFKL